MKLKNILILTAVFLLYGFGFYWGVTAETISQNLGSIFLVATAFPLISIMKADKSGGN